VKLVPAVKCVKCDVDGSDKISIKEEAIDIKDEIPEAITLASVKTENAIRLQGLFEVVANYTYLFPALCYIVGSIHILKFGLQS